MTARKIRMTAVGLVAMPADRDERTVQLDDLGRQSLVHAFGELHEMAEVAVDDAREQADRAGTYAEKERLDKLADEVERGWDAALNAAADGGIDSIRKALTRAHEAAEAAGLSTEHEDAALAMLPPVAGRQAA